MLNKNIRGQIWVETVIYTLIGLALIGLVLAFITPRLLESRDRLMVEQSIETLNNLDAKINSVLRAPGNIRIFEFTMKRGSFYVDADNDIIRFVLEELKEPYSESGIEIDIGRVTINSTRGQRDSTVELVINYSKSFDLKVVDNSALTDDVKKYTQTSTPYQFSIENHGDMGSGKFVVSINELSGSS
jgi:type II secretory pathway pseudopilin PulG